MPQIKIKLLPWCSSLERLPTPAFWPGEFHGLDSHGVTESQTCLNDFHMGFSRQEYWSGLPFPSLVGHVCRSKRKSVLKDWCWSWNSNLLATWCEELTCWKRPCFWERWRAGGEGDDRGWDGRMAWLTWLMWVWTSSGNWWWTGRPGLLQSMGSQRVRHNWATELNPWSGEVTDQENHERNIHNA